jgi:hypothetical protein
MTMKAVAVLNTGARIRKGRDLMEIKTKGIDLSRAHAGEVPLLDTHSFGNPPLGHVADVLVVDGDGGDGDGLLMATLVFDDSRAGRRAFAMVERGELTGVSCGLRTIDISIHDRDGVALDDEAALKRQDDPNLIFCVRHSILQEVSLCTSGIDPGAIVRACSIDAVTRQMVQQGEAALQRLLHQDESGGPLLRTIIPGRETILHGAPERIAIRR